MKITAALAWWNERPADLEACVKGLAAIADRVVAVDGAYRRYPGATVSSPPEQARAIRRAAKEVGLECVIVKPDRLWAGQIEKRTALMQHAAEGSDWVVIVDADHVIKGDRESVRRQVEAIPEDADWVNVKFVTPKNKARPLDKSAATPWHAKLAGQTLVMAQIFRAYPNFRCVGNHWTYLAEKNGQDITLLYNNDQGGPVLEDYVTEHRTLFRDEAHILAGRQFCDDRELVKSLTGQEDDVPGLPSPKWGYKIPPELNHPMAPWTDVTFVGVYWNEESRIRTLLETVRPWFSNLAIGVQKSDDATIDIVREFADIVVEDEHHGIPEPTFSKVLARVTTPWVFVVSGDELPSPALLQSFQAMLDKAGAQGNRDIDGFGIHFRSTIEGIDFTNEQDRHTRVFKSFLTWPQTMHSGPQGMRRVLNWDQGFIVHSRSLDEMVRDYLRYYRIGLGDKGWDTHNLMMLRECCKGVAGRLGWNYVKAFPWWEEVVATAFSGEDPSGITGFGLATSV